MPASRNDNETEFDGSGFYLLTLLIACAYDWQALVLMFIGEFWILKLIVGSAIFRILLHAIEVMISRTHRNMTQRFGMFYGVLLTMVILSGVVRGSLAISSYAQSEGRRTLERQRAEESCGSLASHRNRYWRRERNTGQSILR